MAKRVIFSKMYSDGIERKTEKDCNTETEARLCCGKWRGNGNCFCRNNT